MEPSLFTDCRFQPAIESMFRFVDFSFGGAGIRQNYQHLFLSDDGIQNGRTVFNPWNGHADDIGGQFRCFCCVSQHSTQNS